MKSYDDNQKLEKLTVNLHSQLRIADLYVSPNIKKHLQEPRGGDGSPKTYESNFFHHDFEQFGDSMRDVRPFAIHCFVAAVLWSISLTEVNP